jgi:hypothetical protein
VSVAANSEISTTDVSLSSPFGEPSTSAYVEKPDEKSKRKKKTEHKKKHHRREHEKEEATNERKKVSILAAGSSKAASSSCLSSPTPSTSSHKTSFVEEISKKIDPIASELMELAKQRRRVAEMKESQIAAQTAALEEREKRAAQRDEERKIKEKQKEERRRMKEEKEKELLEKINSILS